MSWYKGLSGKLADYLSTPYYSADYETGVTYKTQYYKKEFFEQLKEKLGKAAINKQSITLNNAGLNITVAIKKLSVLKGKKPDQKIKGAYWLVPETFYSPIEQQAIILKDNQATRDFFLFFLTKEVSDILYGFGYQPK